MSTRRTFLSELGASIAGLFVAVPVVKKLVEQPIIIPVMGPSGTYQHDVDAFLREYQEYMVRNAETAWEDQFRKQTFPEGMGETRSRFVLKA